MVTMVNCMFWRVVTSQWRFDRVRCSSFLWDAPSSNSFTRTSSIHRSYEITGTRGTRYPVPLSGCPITIATFLLLIIFFKAKCHTSRAFLLSSFPVSREWEAAVSFYVSAWEYIRVSEDIATAGFHVINTIRKDTKTWGNSAAVLVPVVEGWSNINCDCISIQTKQEVGARTLWM